MKRSDSNETKSLDGARPSSSAVRDFAADAFDDSSARVCAEACLEACRSWYESHRNARGGVNTNVMTGGLAVAAIFRNEADFSAESIATSHGGQVKGLSGSFVRGVLKDHGETRPFTSEGGRTSRGTLAIAEDLAERICAASNGFDLDDDVRASVADAMTSFFVGRIRNDYFDKQRIQVVFDTSKHVAAIVSDIFVAAHERSDRPTGTVAQHLVGAILELRFPDCPIGRDAAHAADQQTERQGDFQVGDTAFHVTVAPASKLVDRARDNLRHGFRPVMLVPETEVEFARGLFRSESMVGNVEVVGIESFVGTTLEQLAGYDSGAIRLCVAALVERYNERIEACEYDQSLKFEVPSWMSDLPAFEWSVVTIGEPSEA